MVIPAPLQGPHSLVLFAIVEDETLIQGADTVTPGRIGAGTLLAG
jgi:hypothetical protein